MIGQGIATALWLLRAWSVCAIPAPVTLATLEAAEAHGVRPVVLLGYLCSEHGDDWTESPAACSERGACGPFQLAATWPLAWGYALEDRANAKRAADMAARLVVYSRRRHAACDGAHDWRAHWKAGPGGRDAAPIRWAVRRWRQWEKALGRR